MVLNTKERTIKQLVLLLRTGFFHIVGAGSINKALSVVLSFVLVRILSKVDYGSYAYAYNIVSFFIVINGFGAVSAILQICSELYDDKAKSTAVYEYGFKCGALIDVVYALALLLLGFFAPMAIAGSNTLILVYCVYPLCAFLYDIKLVYLRVHLLNKDYALATNIQTVLMVVFSLAGAYLLNAVGLIVGQITSYLLSFFYLSARYPLRCKRSFRLSKLGRIDYWKVSTILCFNAVLSQTLTPVGTILLGWLVPSNDIVATYQIATLIPFGLLFVPLSVITYIYPYFARNRSDRKWTTRNYLRTTIGCSIAFGAIAVLVIALAHPIVCILFGNAYLEAVPILRILMIGFFIQSSFRIPSGNLLVTQRKLFSDTAIGILTLTVFAISSVVLIRNFSTVGAALAYDIAMAFSACLYVFFYAKAIRNI